MQNIQSLKRQISPAQTRSSAAGAPERDMHPEKSDDLFGLKAVKEAGSLSPTAVKLPKPGEESRSRSGGEIASAAQPSGKKRQPGPFADLPQHLIPRGVPGGPLKRIDSSDSDFEYFV